MNLRHIFVKDENNRVGIPNSIEYLIFKYSEKVGYSKENELFRRNLLTHLFAYLFEIDKKFTRES